MRIRVMFLLACLTLVSAQAFAHGGEEHVIGTVAKLTSDSVTVKTTADTMVTVAIVPATKFIKDKTSAKIADLNVGDRVVIHAKPIEHMLVADTVEFVANK